MPRRVYPPEDVRDFAQQDLYRIGNSGCLSNTHVLTDSGSALTHLEISSAVGWDTPGWRKIRNAGGILPFTSWNKFHLTGDALQGAKEWCTGPGSSRYRYEDWWGNLSALEWSSDELMALIDPVDLSYLVQQAAAGIYSRGFDALTFLVELKQLRQMLSGVGRKLESLTRGKSPGHIQNLWLEGRYGWRTLRYDIDDFVEFLGETNEGRRRFRSSKGLNVQGSWSAYAESTSSGLITGVSRDITWNGSARGTVIADIDVPELSFNPLVTAWEVTRLSFVVDWLLNVGQALEAASFLLLSTAHTSAGGYKIQFDLVRHADHVGVTGSQIVYDNFNAASATATVTRRDPISVSLSPKTKLRLDAWKVTDLFMLVLQRLPRR